MHLGYFLFFWENPQSSQTCDDSLMTYVIKITVSYNNKNDTVHLVKIN